MTTVFLSTPIPDLIQLLRHKRLSVRDLIASVESTINDLDANLKAWVTYDLDKAKSQAEVADKLYSSLGAASPIQGIPFGTKDIFNTKDFPTQMGSVLWKNFTPGNNARSIDVLLEAGGIQIGKTVTAEFAVHGLNESLNPHDTTKTPGTSSSGSAVSVAAGMVPFAIGTQTAGSIIRPSSFCGVWGMKPSFGLIPRTGVLKTTDSLDTVGFIAAHGTSLRLILDSIRVKGPNYPYVYQNVDLGRSTSESTRGTWNVGFLKSHVWELATSYVRDEIETFAAKVGHTRGFNISEVPWSSEFSCSHEIHKIIYNKSLSYYFKNEYKSDDLLTPGMREMIDAGDKISSAVFKEALVLQEQLCFMVQRSLEPYDAVISIATASSAPIRGVLELDDPSLIWTLCHLPAVSAPAFRCPEGMPFGVQFIANRWKDYSLLQCIEVMIEKGLLPNNSLAIAGKL